MRMKSLILIFIALGCGLVASIGISQVMDRDGSGSGDMQMEQILVALVDIDIDTKLTAQNVKLEDWPKAKIPEGAIRSLKEVENKYANARFYKGEALHASKVIENPGNVAIQIPDGYRAMPVKVDEDTVMKAISPGDRVDVMVFLRKGGEIPTTGIFTILKNVRVFAINTETQRSLDPEKGPTNFRTVSLLVKPDHAREVGVAAQIGKILLTLRNPDQKDEEGGETITPLRDLLAGPAHQGSSRASAAAGNPPPILDTLRSSQGAPAAASDAKWIMHILGPDGANQYEWADLQGLPVQSQPRSLPPAPQPRSSEPPPAPEGDTDVAPGAKQPGEEKKPAGNPQDDAARWWQY